MHSTVLINGPLGLVVSVFQRLGPTGTAFIGSILLSVIAISGSINPNNDGMLYIEAAGVFQDQGLDASRQVFDWLFLPVLIATVSSITSIGLESSAYLISTLLLAGICALVVACSRLQFPDSGWAACAVILALPALNSYRDYIIREFGCWFFLFLALLLVLRWVSRPTWWLALAAQISICIAALFRPEALVFIGALIVWQLFSAIQSREKKPLIMMLLMPLALVVGAVALFFMGMIDLPERIASRFSYANPSQLFEAFNNAADQLAVKVLNKYSGDEARSILFFGLISVIPIKFISNLGVFVVPLAYGMTRPGVAALLRKWSPLSWVWVAYLIVLAAFLFNRMFLTARYVGLLDLLIVPLVAVGLAMLFQSLPRWRWLIIVTISIAMLSNVISTSPKKIHHPAAAEWLMQQKVDPERVYIEDAEIAHLAGWSFSNAGKGIATKRKLPKAVAKGRFDLVLVRASKKNQDAENWAEDNGLEVLERFHDAKGRGVLVLRPGQKGASVVPTVTE